MVIGTVIRSHAGGYLVYVDELDKSLQCAARGRIKKEGMNILTGDKVEIDEIDPKGNSAVITSRLKRKNELTRPPLSSVDQVIIVQSIHKPDWNPLLCDRYLVHFQLELGSCKPIICINKSDLASKEELETLRKIYEPLEYSVVIVSALTGEGMDSLISHLLGKVSVLAGTTGVGKSSLINYLDPSLHLKTGVEDADMGKHTTSGSMLYKVHTGTKSSDKPSWIVDTPGFNLVELKHPEPNEIFFEFPEIIQYYDECKYSNCLHIHENGCNVIANIEKISSFRYESYKALVGEAQAENDLRKATSKKIDSGTKITGQGKDKGTAVPKLKGRYRNEGRNTTKQQVTKLARESKNGFSSEEEY